jgi:hypothetical protein
MAKVWKKRNLIITADGGVRELVDEPSEEASQAVPARNRGRPSAKTLIADEIDRRQKTPQRWSKVTYRRVVARDLWVWLEERRRIDKTIPRVKNSRAMESLLQRNRLWPPEN